MDREGPASRPLSPSNANGLCAQRSSPIVLGAVQAVVPGRVPDPPVALLA